MEKSQNIIITHLNSYTLIRHHYHHLQLTLLNMLEGICNNVRYWPSLVLWHWNKVTRINLSSNMGVRTEGRGWEGDKEGGRKEGKEGGREEEKKEGKDKEKNKVI
jgi:hypothetical protein